jgi:uncharacterized protein (UPF0333 family)
MLDNIIKIWREFKIVVIAAAIAIIYFFGIKRGKDDEKAQNTKATLANVSAANRARARLNDPVFVRRMRQKYTRE